MTRNRPSARTFSQFQWLGKYEILSHTIKKLSLGLIQIYQGYIRAMLPFSCRFLPSCSEYIKQAIIKYGIVRGSWKGLKRLLRCHPFSRQVGYDPLT